MCSRRWSSQVVLAVYCLMCIIWSASPDPLTFTPQSGDLVTFTPQSGHPVTFTPQSGDPVTSTLHPGVTPAPREGDVRLVGSDTAGTGTVQVFIQHGVRVSTSEYDVYLRQILTYKHDPHTEKDTWGFICDDGWSLEAGHVICRTLGLPRAVTYTVEDMFDTARSSGGQIVLDDVQCFGDEDSVMSCRHLPPGVHDCQLREAAGVFCAPPDVVRRNPRPRQSLRSTTTTSENSNDVIKPRTTLVPVTPVPRDQPQNVTEPARATRRRAHHQRFHPARPYKIRVIGGRNPDEGRVEVRVRGRWGVICSDSWDLMDAMVVCRQSGKHYARMATQTSHFGGNEKIKLVGGIHCDGDEDFLHQCAHEQVGRHVVCQQADYIAGVICTDKLPDLVPNATLLETSAYLQDRAMIQLQCAMEENCASSSAYVIKQNNYDWHYYTRRLLRFSSSIWNYGTADFKPDVPKTEWEWHLCHMHYHSMTVFAAYDVLDDLGDRVAEGHKASFCLEDVQCKPGVEKKYACRGFGEQGVSVGCADDYLHDIDCQWIDMTDVTEGNYTFRVIVNPELLVAELDFRNNIVHCNLMYAGGVARITNCQYGWD